MRQDILCTGGGVLPNSDLSQPPPTSTALRLKQAHQFSTGANVVVAVIDTGVQPHSRLPGVLPGGDYIADRDGLSDCDGHGTIVAGLIGAAPSERDGFVGVAPDAKILAIRQTSQAFVPEPADVEHESDSRSSRVAIDVRSLARAIVHAADLGARVIDISLAICTSSSETGDQSMLGAALKYAVNIKDVLVVAAAGDTTEGSGGGSGVSSNCRSNPEAEHSTPQDPRNWARADTVSSPSWFDEFVMSVGSTLPDGSVVGSSMAGPWVSVAAPGYGIVSLSSSDSNSLINAMPGRDRNLVPIFGSSCASAFVSGTAALLRSRFPELSAREVATRIIATAHPPAGGKVNNQIGHGVIDPVAALTYTVPTEDTPAVGIHPKALAIPPAAATDDARPKFVAAIAAGSILALAAAVWAISLFVGGSRRL
ncbi:type VII secretion-associated serine protease mycosin [Mycobacterium simulans]